MTGGERRSLEATRAALIDIGPPASGLHQEERTRSISFQSSISAQVSRDRGATAVNRLVVALIAIVIIVAVALLGTNLSTIFQRTADSV